MTKKAKIRTAKTAKGRCSFPNYSMLRSKDVVMSDENPVMFTLWTRFGPRSARDCKKSLV